MSRPKLRADISDDNSANPTPQHDISENTLAGRIRSKLGTRDVAWLVRNSGVPSSTVHSILAGTIPRADNGLKIANALECSLEWLLSGVDRQAPAAAANNRRATDSNLADAAEADWVMLPRYNPFEFGPDGKPEPIGRQPFRKDWLARSVRVTNNLWLCDMPSEAMPDVAHEGDTLLCHDDVTPLGDGRVYLFLLDGRPIVRRVQIRPEGLVLTSTDPSIAPMIFRADDMEGAMEGLAPVARVLGSIRLLPA